MKKEVVGSPFIRESETHEKVLTHLKKHPTGLSTQDIEIQTGISRKAVEKHLKTLSFENEIYMKQFGSTRVYYPNHRFHHLDFRYFDHGKKRFYFDLIENDIGTSLLIQQKMKDKNGNWIIKGSIFIPLDASQDFAKTLGNLLKSKKLEAKIREAKEK